MRKVALVGSDGFVGSAISQVFSNDKEIKLILINRENFDSFIGQTFDVLIEAACNSKKYLADNDPLNEIEMSVSHRLRTLTQFKANFHIHLSSVDVYEDLSKKELTKENINILKSSSNYGSHKLVAETLVKHYADNWLIFRLSGMVGKGLRKNPVYDILNDSKLFINENSKYQYISTKFVAKSILSIFNLGVQNEIFNVAGEGLISPKEIAKIFSKKINIGDNNNLEPRIVDIDCCKISKYIELPNTLDEIKDFKKACEA